LGARTTRNEETALLCRSSDIKAMADAICRLKDDEELSEVLSKDARELAEDLWTMKNVRTLR